MNTQYMKNFIRERNEALLSLDREKILAYAKKYQVKIPSNELTFWAGLHKARLEILSIPEEEKEVSRQWLREHGFKRVDGSEP